jgi:hypothetical protein
MVWAELSLLKRQEKGLSGFAFFFQVKCSHKSITSGREIIFRCQFHTDAVENNFLRLGKSQLDGAYKGECVHGGGPW